LDRGTVHDIGHDKELDRGTVHDIGYYCGSSGFRNNSVGGHVAEEFSCWKRYFEELTTADSTIVGDDPLQSHGVCLAVCAIGSADGLEVDASPVLGTEA
jgi:hypothetical protein